MAIVDLLRRTYQLGGVDPRRIVLGLDPPSREVAFQTHQEIFGAILEGDRHVLQSVFSSALSSDPVLADWVRRRGAIPKTSYFYRYQRKDYDNFNAGARALFGAEVDVTHAALARSLMAELAASTMSCPPGQVLFHGRADFELSDAEVWPSFLSTSLHPVVAERHASKRAGRSGKPPVVYVIRTNVAIPAIVGHRLDNYEYEVLLPAGVQVQERGRMTVGEITVVDAVATGVAALPE